MMARADALGLDAQIQDDTDSMNSAEDSDVEAQLEAFMGQAVQGTSSPVRVRESQASGEDLPRI